MNAAETQAIKPLPVVRMSAQMPSACERLDSWKEIASYLRRSVRCVQRWEKNEGLPILRHRHAHGATIYAYRHELDDWWHGRESSDNCEFSLLATMGEERMK